MDLIDVLDAIAQIGVMILSPLAMFMVSNKNKWGFVVGLGSQPFWFTTTIIHHQIGVTVLNVIYTAIWLNGFHKWFFKDRKIEIPKE